MPSSPVILSEAPAEFISTMLFGAESKDPENAQAFFAASGNSHEAASRELPKAALKNETSSGSFDSSSSRQAGTRPSLRMTDLDGHFTWRQQVAPAGLGASGQLVASHSITHSSTQ